MALTQETKPKIKNIKPSMAMDIKVVLFFISLKLFVLNGFAGVWEYSHL